MEQENLGVLACLPMARPATAQCWVGRAREMATTGGSFIPQGGRWWDVVWITALAVVALVALTGAAEGWLLAKTNALERVLLLVAGLLLVYPKAAYDAIGFALLVAAVVLQLVRRRTALAASG